MDAKIGISTENRNKVAIALGKTLADEFVLYTKTRKAHWNVEAPDFYNKHKFFEDQYAQLAEIVDELAERIRKIGHYAPASLKQFLSLTQLTEEDRGGHDGESYIKTLLADHESIIISLRGEVKEVDNAHKDAGSSDFLTSLIEQHETMAWMLRAHLPKD